MFECYFINKRGKNDGIRGSDYPRTNPMFVNHEQRDADGRLCLDETSIPFTIPISAFIQHELINNYARIRSSTLINLMVFIDCRMIPKNLFMCRWDRKSENYGESERGREYCKKMSCRYAKDTVSRWLSRIGNAIVSIESAMNDSVDRLKRKDYDQLMRMYNNSDVTPDRKAEIGDRMKMVELDVRENVYKKYDELLNYLALQKKLILDIKPFFLKHLDYYRARIDKYWEQARIHAENLPFIPPTKDLESLLRVLNESVLGSHLDKLLKEVNDKIIEVSNKKKDFDPKAVLK